MPFCEPGFTQLLATRFDAKKRSQMGKIALVPPREAGVQGSVRLHRPTFSTDTLLADVWCSSCLAVCSQLPSDHHLESQNLRGQTITRVRAQITIVEARACKKKGQRSNRLRNRYRSQPVTAAPPGYHIPPNRLVKRTWLRALTQREQDSTKGLHLFLADLQSDDSVVVSIGASDGLHSQLAGAWLAALAQREEASSQAPSRPPDSRRDTSPRTLP